MPTVSEVEARLSGPCKRVYLYLRGESLSLCLPSMRDMSKSLDLSVSSVHYHLRRLAALGLVCACGRAGHTRYRPAGARVVFDGDAPVEVPDERDDPREPCACDDP